MMVQREWSTNGSEDGMARCFQASINGLLIRSVHSLPAVRECRLAFCHADNSPQKTANLDTSGPNCACSHIYPSAALTYG